MQPLGNLGFELAEKIKNKVEAAKMIADKYTYIFIKIKDADIREMTAASIILVIELPYTTSDKRSTWIEFEDGNVIITVYAKIED